jgi:MFS family permease
MPAATGMVADLAPETRRAQWIGVLSGGASFGWIAGPVLGGLLYDQWGYGTALLVCIGMAVVALLLAALTIRETSARPQPRQAGASLRRSLHEMRAALPLSLRPMLVALAVYFAVMFAWAFIEPRFMFFAYDDLAWSSSMLGAVMSTYGVALMLGEFGLARLSDRLGRRPVIIAGLVLFSAQFIGLALFRNYVLIAIAFVIAGLGNALFDPALTASLLDSTPAANRAGVLGLKSTVGSVGSILGPALAMAFTSLLSAQGIFFGAAGVVYVMVWIAAVAGRAPRPAEPLAHSA